MNKSWRSAWCEKAELSDSADSEITCTAPNRKVGPRARPARFERSKNVVQVLESSDKFHIKGEQRKRKRFASVCHKLPFSSGLRRLRQDLINLVPRLEGRRSIQLSYGRTVQSILPSSTYSYFLENFSFKSRCNRCSNGLFGWILGKIETKSNGLGLSQAHANLLEQMRVNL